MKAFIYGCGGAILIAVVSAVVLELVPLSSADVYSSGNVRLD